MADKTIKDLSSKTVSTQGAEEVQGGAKAGAKLNPRRRN